MAIHSRDDEATLRVLEERYGDSSSEGEVQHQEIDPHRVHPIQKTDAEPVEIEDDGLPEAVPKFLDQSVHKVGRKHMQPIKNILQKLDAHLSQGIINYDPCEEISNVQSDARVGGSLKTTDKKMMKTRIRVTDKSDRATVDSVLDRRTRTILLKMLNKGIFSDIYGVISTGKEANVYHGIDSSNVDVAIKIYKTSILGFRDRDRYVSGDYRFRRGYSQSNPRKMVQTWAEKEMRNLNRLISAGIEAPRPVELRMHILVMEFIGIDSKAAPRLKDVHLDDTQLKKAQYDLCLVLWKLFNRCKLVHADFSEYNILYSNGDCVVIDVSQSVDLDHPLMLDFLRDDCQHLIDFFQRQGIPTLTLRELCEFVTDPSITESNSQEALEKLLAQSEKRYVENTVKEDASEVFKQAFLPRRLDEVIDYERDVENVQQGKAEGVFYQTIVGLKEDLSGVRLVPQIMEMTEKEENGAGSDADEETEEEEEDRKQKLPLMSKDEIKALRKENKKVVKEANRERRKTKTPKHVKKQLVKKGKKKH